MRKYIMGFGVFLVVMTGVFLYSCASQDTTESDEAAPVETQADASATGNVSRQITNPFNFDNSIGALETYTIQGAYIHRFYGTDPAHVNSYVIEGRDELVVINVQYFKDQAKEFRKFVDYLQKPVDRVIITHSHPGQYLGLEYFSDLETYALPIVRDNISKNGNKLLTDLKTRFSRSIRASYYESQLPSTTTIPKIDMETSFSVGAYSYAVDNYPNTENNDQSLIEIKALKIAFISDLITTGEHLIVYSPDEYIIALDDIQKLMDDGYRIFAGHGKEISKNDLSIAKNYIRDAKILLDKNVTTDDYKQAMGESYPNLSKLGIVVLMMSDEDYSLGNKTVLKK